MNENELIKLILKGEREMVASQGRRMAFGQGKGLAPGGPNFVDENKNGIRDLRETIAGK